jgi:hypothetical protein
MGSITNIFSITDNFDDLIEKKLDTLDMWIKKIEKSNIPYHIQPTLYNDIRNYVEYAFRHDFNLVVEEFDFYHQITPKMQTELIQNTRVFQEFERSFNHFFDECERGFTNELIIQMFCRIYPSGWNVITYRSNVKQMYFIRQGIVEVFNSDQDEIVTKKPILYLPKFSYFGDYQILLKLKSNLQFKTLGEIPPEKQKGLNFEELPQTFFMCVSKKNLQYLCDLFPQTANNLRRKALDRRHRFMLQKATNSQRVQQKIQQMEETSLDGEGRVQYEEKLEEFHDDEEAEATQSQKEDIKAYLQKLNKRIDTLVDALKHAETYISAATDEKTIREQIQNRSKLTKADLMNRDNLDASAELLESEPISIAQLFNQKLQNAQ